jgi:hypothetical protein
MLDFFTLPTTQCLMHSRVSIFFRKSPAAHSSSIQPSGLEVTPFFCGFFEHRDDDGDGHHRRTTKSFVIDGEGDGYGLAGMGEQQAGE